MDTVRGRKTRKKGEERKALPKSRPKRGQVETNISKQVLSSIIIQVKGKTCSSIETGFKPEVAISLWQ